MTELERRQRLLALVKADARCGEMERECRLAQAALEEYSRELPEEQREFLWRYPGAMYYLYHWTMNVVCKHMRFPEEEEKADCHTSVRTGSQ